MSLLAPELSAIGSFGDSLGTTFDFVLALGNFTSRDEDVFLQLHAAEQPSLDEAPPAQPEPDGYAGPEGEGAGWGVGAEVPELRLGTNADGMRRLGVPAGGVYSVVLGNRSTSARYYLQRQGHAEELLQALTLTPRSPRAAAEAALVARQAASGEGEARLPSALGRYQLQSIQARLARCNRHVTAIQARLARCWTLAFCLASCNRHVTAM